MTSFMFLSVVLVVFYAYETLANRGVDVSEAVSEAQWKCIANEKYGFAMVRVFQSNGTVDPNGAQTTKNAHAAGIKYVDGYIFPCPKCGNAKGQIKATTDNLKSKGANITQLFLDIEGEDYWTGNGSDNVKFIQDMVNELNAQNVKVSIYTSASQWQLITGNSKKFSNLQLWYAHYDYVQNFTDFKAFGGWKKPSFKQFKLTTDVCDVTVGLNWYPCEYFC